MDCGIGSAVGPIDPMPLTRKVRYNGAIGINNKDWQSSGTSVLDTGTTLV